MTIGQTQFHQCRLTVNEPNKTMETLIKLTKNTFEGHETFANSMVLSVYSVSRRRQYKATTTPAKLMKPTKTVATMHPMFVMDVHIVRWAGQEPLPIARHICLTTRIVRAL